MLWVAPSDCRHRWTVTVTPKPVPVVTRLRRVDSAAVIAAIITGSITQDEVLSRCPARLSQRHFAGFDRCEWLGGRDRSTTRSARIRSGSLRRAWRETTKLASTNLTPPGLSWGRAPLRNGGHGALAMCAGQGRTDAGAARAEHGPRQL